MSDTAALERLRHALSLTDRNTWSFATSKAEVIGLLDTLAAQRQKIDELEQQRDAPWLLGRIEELEAENADLTEKFQRLWGATIDD